MLGDYMSVQINCNVTYLSIGGTSIREDFTDLDYGQHDVSGTPGRRRQSIWYVTSYRLQLTPVTGNMTLSQ